MSSVFSQDTFAPHLPDYCTNSIKVWEERVRLSTGEDVYFLHYSNVCSDIGNRDALSTRTIQPWRDAEFLGSAMLCDTCWEDEELVANLEEAVHLTKGIKKWVGVYNTFTERIIDAEELEDLAYLARDMLTIKNFFIRNVLESAEEKLEVEVNVFLDLLLEKQNVFHTDTVRNLLINKFLVSGGAAAPDFGLTAKREEVVGFIVDGQNLPQSRYFTHDYGLEAMGSGTTWAFGKKEQGVWIGYAPRAVLQGSGFSNKSLYTGTPLTKPEEELARALFKDGMSAEDAAATARSLSK